MRFGLLTFACAPAIVVAACGLDARGTGAELASSTLPDGATRPETSMPDASTCREITTLTPGSLVAPKVATAPVVDGDLGDWESCFESLDRQSAQLTREIVGGSGYVSGEFSVVHDGTKVFVAARVKGIAPLGESAAPNFHQNDSIEVYFDGDGTTEAGYGADAVQLVVDHAGRLQAWRGDGVAFTASGARAAAKLAADGSTFTIELEVDATTFGRTSLSNVLGFDIAFNNGSGSAQLSQIVWFQKCRASSGCGCANGGDAPFCDSRQFGSLMLAP